MRKILFCLLLIPTVLQAQQPLYTAANLPLALTKNADAVYWIDEGELDISSPSKYTLNRHQIITLLNAGAKDHLVQVFGTDKFYKMENIQVYLYNSQGVQVKKFTKKDFQTESYDDNISVLTDDKIMYLQTSAPGYPCTIEIRYQQNVSSYLTLPSWSFNNPDEAVITSRYSVLVPQDLDIRQRTRGSNLAPVITTEGKRGRLVIILLFLWWNWHPINLNMMAIPAILLPGPILADGTTPCTKVLPLLTRAVKLLSTEYCKVLLRKKKKLPGCTSICRTTYGM
jgi:hypothetical protein